MKLQMSDEAGWLLAIIDGWERLVSELLSYTGLSRHVKNAHGNWSQWIHYTGAQVVLLSGRKEKR
jgi:hypothetical protein